MTFVPCLVRSLEGSELVSITLGHPLVDGYLEFVGARGAVNTWLAVAYDLKVFFEVVAKEPAEVTAADVFAFLAAQRAPRRRERVVRIEDGEPGLAARTIARRLSSVAGLSEYLLARGDAGVGSNPVPRGLAGRRAGRRGRGGVRLVRTPRTLPRVLSPGDVDRLLGALRTRRDRAMVFAMLLGGLRRCEVLGLLRCDVNVGERRVQITCGKAGVSGWCRSPAGSSEPSASIWSSSVPPRRRPRRASLSLKDRGAVCRCRRPGSMRCLTARGRGRGSRAARVISCGIRA